MAPATTMEEKQFYLSPELAPRLGAIDIGSNSIRLMIAEPHRDGSYRVLDEEKETTRLAAHLNSTGRLPPAAVATSLDALRRMKRIAEGFQVRELKVIATCAVREAADGEEFVRRVREEVGLDVEVISAEQEAHLAFLSVSRAFPLEGKNVAVADIGGGSTEVVLSSGAMVEAVWNTQLGAVRLTEMFRGGQDPDDYDDLLRAIDRELRRFRKKSVLVPHVLIGSGGTFTTMAEIVMLSRGRAGIPLRGCEITRADVSHLLDRLRKLSPKARRSVPGLSPDRADIILAGVAIIDRLLDHFRLNRLLVHDQGVRDGLMRTMIDQLVGAQPPEDPAHPLAAVERFATNCGVDVRHTRQVALLGGWLFDALAPRFKLPPEDRRLLEAAAWLQDVGYLISYEDHHKHSYRLIQNSRLPGFRPRELELVANVARYHRGSVPKKKHANYRRLSSAEQQRVARLAAILRLAGGLDRTNLQLVTGLSVVDDPHGLAILVEAAEYPEVDIHAAQRRAEFFADVFDVTVRIDVPSAPARVKHPR